MANYNVYSQLTNELFYRKDENDNWTEKGTLIKTIKDDKLIIVLHTLYVLTNFRRKATFTLDYLIEECGYIVNKDNRKSFKDLLIKLHEQKLILLETEISSGKIIIVDTERLMLDANKNYVQVADEEVEIFKTIEDCRLRNTLFKLYVYLKARTYKRSINEKTGEKYKLDIDFAPQVTYQTYEYIAKYTGLAEARIKEYIDKLQEMGLIKYENCGKKYHRNDKNKKLNECPNVYTICNLNEDDEQELEIGLKQCKYDLEEKGYVIIKKEYKNNNRQLNGKIGGLTKKLNNGTITDEQIEELNSLKENEEKIKEDYKNKQEEEKSKKKGIGKQIEYRNDIDVESKAKEMRNRGIDPFTNKPYKTKNTHDRWYK